MAVTKMKYTPRAYQKYILDKVVAKRGTNLLIELDCGLGKRFITHQIVSVRFPHLKTIIVVHSSSSLAETMDYLTNEYDGLQSELGELSSRTPSALRPHILQERRVIIATPQILAKMIERYSELVAQFELLIINEVDTLTRRIGGRTNIVYPWPTILYFFKDKWIIGMSGTLRDEHAVFTDEQLEIRNELLTLQQHIHNSEVITMEEILQTDVMDHLEPTIISVETVTDPKIRGILIALDTLIKNTRDEIMQELGEQDMDYLVEDDPRRVHLLLERLPIDEELKSQYSGLLMLRRYVYSMPPHSFLRQFHGDLIHRFFDVGSLRRTLPKVSSKVLKVLDLVAKHNKTVVLASYIAMVNQIERVLSNNSIRVLTITGSTQDKGSVLREFKEDPDIRALIMSPVGERDLDIPQADLMVVCDVISTTKTMYQKFKRTRGGHVIILAYAGTSEEQKVSRLIAKILENYPWSTAVLKRE